MSKSIEAIQALRNYKRNIKGTWNKSANSSTRSANPNDAANRMFDGFAEVDATYCGPRFPLNVPVFTMGSCFAREIEKALINCGGNIVSVDGSIRRPEFLDGEGRIRSGFLHRFTPASMALEFRWPFGRQDGWADDSLIFRTSEDQAIDLNYMAMCADRSHAAVRTRRQVAGELTRKVRDARVVIVTLGLSEGWVHRPTGLPVNAIDWRYLKTNPEAFELKQMDVLDAIESLESILQTIEAVHCDGDFQLFVTVSPVPFVATFSGNDVVVANATSKSMLRAAAAVFVDRHERAHYFPSYELVTYSNPTLAWRPDRIHVESAMVGHIMNRFVETVFAA